jgi:hypothetical protein
VVPSQIAYAFLGVNFPLETLYVGARAAPFDQNWGWAFLAQRQGGAYLPLMSVPRCKRIFCKRPVCVPVDRRFG